MRGHRAGAGAWSRRAPRLLAAAAAAAVAIAALGPAQAAPAGPAARVPRAAGRTAGPGVIGHAGRWLTDAQGRVVLLHGVNLVAKGLQTPAERGFGADDAQWLEDNGFDVVRLGLSANAFMPTPGVVDSHYLASFTQTVTTLTDHGLLVLVDLHQDGWGPTTSGNGFPDWMTFTHGAKNTHTGFPLYYVTNPAIQAAFDSFWANEPGPGGVGIGDQVATMFSALAGAVGTNPNVIGYDTLNEPWPGTTWSPCLDDPNGCPALDAARLDPFNRRVDAAVRAKDPTHLVFGEPFVLFNFGQSATHVALPGGDARSGLSFHMYTTDVALEPKVLQRAAAWSATTGGALLATEFGATRDPATIDRMVGEMDHALLPWMWWSYDGGMVNDLQQPPTGANLGTAVDAALVRPHPVLVAGTPTALDYDRTNRILRFAWSATSPGGRRLPAASETVIKVPPSVYGRGYRIKVTGGTVTSAADADRIVVTTSAGAASVTVKVWAAESPEPPDQPTVPTTSTSTTAPAGPATPGASAPGATPVAGQAAFTG